MKIKKQFAKICLRLKGWKITGKIPDNIKKCVIIVAPHTSIEDFFIGRFAYWYLETPVKFLIKDKFFKNPIMRWALTKMGGIPVDRDKNKNIVTHVAALFKQYDNLNVIITPEGTRKLVQHWKKGFYYIALMAKVPIILGFLDFKKKEGGFGPVLYPSGDYDTDWKTIENFYRGKVAKYPNKFNLS